MISYLHIRMPMPTHADANPCRCQPMPMPTHAQKGLPGIPDVTGMQLLLRLVHVTANVTTVICAVFKRFLQEYGRSPRCITSRNYGCHHIFAATLCDTRVWHMLSTVGVLYQTFRHNKPELAILSEFVADRSVPAYGSKVCLLTTAGQH